MKFIRPFAVCIVALITVITAPAQSIGEELQFPATGLWDNSENQINVLECSNPGDISITLKVILKDDRGIKLTPSHVLHIPSRGTKHLSLSSTETTSKKGTILIKRLKGKSDFLTCATLIYRLADSSTTKQIQYIYALPVENPLKGETGGIFNSHLVDQLAGEVVNRLTIINPGKEPFSAQVLFHSEDGSLSGNERYSVINLPAGHQLEIPLPPSSASSSAGIYRIIPNALTQPYKALLFRESHLQEKINSVFPLFAQSGSCNPQALPLVIMDHSAHWTEVGNLSNASTKVRILTRNRRGKILTQQTKTLRPYSLIRLRPDESLKTDFSGSLQLECHNTDKSKRKLLAQMLHYGFSVTDPLSSIEWAYANQSKINAVTQNALIVYPVNSYLDAENMVRLIDQSLETTPLRLRLYQQSGSKHSPKKTFSISPGSTFQYSLQADVGKNFIGLGLIDAASTTTSYQPELLRVFPNNSGGIGAIAIIPSGIVPPPEKTPTVSLHALPSQITKGEPATISWTSTNVETCVASGGWSGSRQPAGTEVLYPSTTINYSLLCDGPHGTVQQSVSIVVEPITNSSTTTTTTTSTTTSTTTTSTISTTTSLPPIPQLTLQANPSTIIMGQASELSWVSAHMSSCEASSSDVSWDGPRLLSGTIAIIPFDTTTYTITCTNGSISITKNIVVTVNRGNEQVGDPLELVHLDLSGRGKIRMRWSSNAQGQANTRYIARLLITGSPHVFTQTLPALSPQPSTYETVFDFTQTANGLLEAYNQARARTDFRTQICQAGIFVTAVAPDGEGLFALYDCFNLETFFPLPGNMTERFVGPNENFELSIGYIMLRDVYQASRIRIFHPTDPQVTVEVPGNQTTIVIPELTAYNMEKVYVSIIDDQQAPALEGVAIPHLEERFRFIRTFSEWKHQIAIGVPFTFNAQVIDGIPPYEYSIEPAYALDPIPSSMTVDQTGARLQWTPELTDAGQFRLNVEARDQSGRVITETLYLNIGLQQVPAPDPAQPGEVMIVQNAAFPDLNSNGVSDSLEVGEYYRATRNIPTENVLTVSTPSFEKLNSTAEAATLLNQIKNHLETTRDTTGTLLKNKILYVVTTYGMPEHFFETGCTPNLAQYSFCLTPFDEAIKTLWDNFTAGDSESAGLYHHTIYSDPLHIIGDDPVFFMPHFRTLERQKRARGLLPHYLTSRLDGPTAEIAKGLVDKAIYAERFLDLRTATGYFDRWGGQGFGDGGIHNEVAWETLLPQAPIVRIEDIYPNAPTLPISSMPNYQAGDVHQADFYNGWYSHQTSPIFDWNPGATAYEHQSFTARHIRYSRNHMSIKLLEGVTGFQGNLDHYARGAWAYYLSGNRFLKSWANGYDLGEASHLSALAAWTIRIGDPLYRIPRRLESDNPPPRDLTPPTISNPTVESRPDGIHFTWNTNEIAHSIVEYGLTTTYGTTLRDLFNRMARTTGPNGIYDPKYYTKRHGIDLFHTFVAWKNISPNTTYYYRLTSTDPAGNVTFSTGTFLTPSTVPFAANAWNPQIASYGTIFPTSTSSAADRTYRVILRASKILENGSSFRVHFQAGSGTGSLQIDRAALGQATNSQAFYADIVPGSLKAVTFRGGSQSLTLPAGTGEWSDWIPGTIDETKDYSLSFYVAANGPISKYDAKTVTGGPSYETFSRYVAGNHVMTEQWSTLTPTTTVLIGIDGLEVR